MHYGLPLPLLLPLLLSAAPSYCFTFPVQRATTGVNATVGGNRTGDSALCAAYAIAKVPIFSLESFTDNPILDRRLATSTPVTATAAMQSRERDQRKLWGKCPPKLWEQGPQPVEASGQQFKKQAMMGNE